MQVKLVMVLQVGTRGSKLWSGWWLHRSVHLIITHKWASLTGLFHVYVKDGKFQRELPALSDTTLPTSFSRVPGSWVGPASSFSKIPHWN